MKVYYRLGDLEAENISDFNLNIETFEQQTLAYFMEKNKYRYMWALRSIENIITEEGGKITVNEEGHIFMDKFSNETIAKMQTLISLEFGQIKNQ
ncbi:hypothetical protein [Ferruginibacter sp.]